MKKKGDIKEKAYNIIPYQELTLFEKPKEGEFRKITRGQWQYESVFIKMYIINNHIEPPKETILKTILAKAEIMAQMGQQSQYFVQLRGVVLEEDCYALVLESVDNDLSQVLQQRPQELTWKVCCQIAAGVAVGLFRLHKKKITHGNLKSQNVLLTPDFQPKLTNVGSPFSPTPDFKKDIFDFGALLLELSHSSAEIPKEFKNIVHACMDSEPSKRPAIEALVKDLRALMQHSSSPDEIKLLPDKVLAWNLVIEEKWDACIRLAKSEFFTQEILLSEHPESKTNGMEGITIPWYLASLKDSETSKKCKKCEELISLFDQQNLINTQILAATPTDENHPEYGANTLAMWSTRTRPSQLLTSWIKKKLLTKEILGSSFQNKEYPFYGLNAASLIIKEPGLRQLDILKILEIVDLSMLVVKAKNSTTEDTALGALAYYGHWASFAVLIKDKYFYPEILLNKWTGIYKLRAAEIIFLMVLDEQWGLIDELSELDYITQPLLASHIARINVLLLLAQAQKWELIKKFLDKGLISPALLPSHSPYNENIPGWIKVTIEDANFLWLVARSNQGDLFRQLVEKGLVDSELLGFCPKLKQAPFCGANVVWLLVYFEQWEIIQDLLDRKLITSSLLASRLEGTEPDGFQGMSVLDLIVRKKKWDLLEACDEQGLIITPTLRSCPENKSDEYYGCHLATMLLLQDKQKLVKRLIPKINTELLLQTGNSPDSFLALLLEKREFTLILELLNSPLNPFRIVPWRYFLTDPLIQHYQNDAKTLEQLVGIGIFPRSIKLPKKIEKIFQEPDDMVHYTFYPNNDIVLDLKNFNFESLRNYFNHYVVHKIQAQITFARSLSKEFESFPYCGNTITFILKLTLEYALGSQEEYGWPDLSDQYLEEMQEQTISSRLLNSAEISRLTGTFLSSYERNNAIAAYLWDLVLTQNWISCINLTAQNHLNSSIILLEHPESKRYHMEGINIFWYLISIYTQDNIQDIDTLNLNKFLEVLIDRNLITEAALISAPTNSHHPQYGEDVLQCLISNGPTFCFSMLLMKGVITFDVVNSARTNPHVLQKLIIRNQWDIILLLIHKKIITKDMLMFPYTAKINLFGMLAGYQRWDIIKKLGHLVTSELLLSGVATTTQYFEDINVIAWFAMHKQWELIKLFIDEINTQMLIAHGKYPSALSVLLEQKQFGLIQELQTASLAPLQTVPWQRYIQSDSKAFCGDSMQSGQTTYHLENFDYRSQAEYWSLRNLETIKQQILCVGLLFAEWKLSGESLSKLSYLILFYASEDQQGCRQAMFLSNDSTEVSEDTVAPQHKIGISDLLQQGMSFFAEQPDIQQKIDLITHTRFAANSS